MEIKNSSGKIIGFTLIKDNYILIHNDSKPELFIENLDDIKKIKEHNRDDNFIRYLYDNYFLTIGEIASLYDVCYATINKQIRNINCQTTRAAGRRNRSYGKHQSELQKQKISNSIKDLYAQGVYSNVKPYERTEEIRKKISNGLKKYYAKYPQNPEPHRKNWENGIYDKVDFHRGIGGSFYSLTNQKKIFFRSLLELYYMLSLEEKNITYKYEPIHMRCDDNSVYTPDMLIDNHQLIELKSKKYLNSLGEESYNEFLYKKEQAEKYCLNHGLIYCVIYDEDIGFDSARFKRHLKNHPDIIDKYSIVFNQPERMAIK